MALTCGDRESPSQMMRFGAVVGNCVLLSAVVTGGLPQLCPGEIGERTACGCFEQTCDRHTTTGLAPVEQSRRATTCTGRRGNKLRQPLGRPPRRATERRSRPGFCGMCGQSPTVLDRCTWSGRRGHRCFFRCSRRVIISAMSSARSWCWGPSGCSSASTRSPASMPLSRRYTWRQSQSQSQADVGAEACERAADLVTVEGAGDVVGILFGPHFVRVERHRQVHPATGAGGDRPGEALPPHEPNANAEFYVTAYFRHGPPS